MDSKTMLQNLDREFNAKAYEADERKQALIINWLEKGGFTGWKHGKGPIIYYGDDLIVDIINSDEPACVKLQVFRNGRYAQWDIPQVSDGETQRKNVRYAMYMCLKKLGELEPKTR